MFKGLTLFLVFIGLSFGLKADEVEFVIDGPRVAVVDSYFKIEFKLNTEPDNFAGPDFGDLEVVAGPISSQMSSYSYSNGKSISSNSFVFTYGVVAPREGTFTIPPAKVEINGKFYQTKPFPIEIVKERSSGGSSAAEDDQQASRSSRARNKAIAKDDIFLRMSVDRKTLYKGEPIVATLKIYDRTEAIVGVKDVKEPDFNGFWKQELQAGDGKVEQETFNGKVYRTQTMGKFLLFPQKSGTLEIGSLNMTVVARIVVDMPASSGRSMFDDFFGSGVSMQDVDCKIASQPIKINVKELPSGAPVEFDGAVGEFAIDCDIKPTELSANSGGDITIRITGAGNMPLINAPKISLPSMFEIYPAKTSEKLDITAYGVKGYKQFDYPFIARAEGEHEITPFTFSYFDPVAGVYKVITTQPYTLKVLRDVSGSSANKNSSIVSGVVKEELKIFGDDIRFIHTGESKLRAKNDFFVASIGYIVSLILMLILFVSTMVYLRKRIKEMRDVVRVKNKRANKIASKRLKAANSYMNASKQNEFYQEMLSAMLGYVSDKLNIPVAELSKDNISRQLLSKGVDQTIVDDLLRVISDCEMAQYSPIESSQMNVIYSNAVELIGRVEKYTIS